MALQSFTKIEIFGLKINHLATLNYEIIVSVGPSLSKPGFTSFPLGKGQKKG
jgi:hypothetical protein